MTTAKQRNGSKEPLCEAVRWALTTVSEGRMLDAIRSLEVQTQGLQKFPPISKSQQRDLVHQTFWLMVFYAMASEFRKARTLARKLPVLQWQNCVELAYMQKGLLFHVQIPIWGMHKASKYYKHYVECHM